jgi:D-alanyl-lipoteichoic acid acyltransferase DltB (MBOAT superfamily)
MLFNSYEFIFIFLPISFFIYFYLNHKRLTIASKSWLVFTSLFFYSWWNIAYLPLILASVLVNYTISNSMLEYHKNNKNLFSKKQLLQFGLLFNIGVLCYFKYMDFFIQNTNTILSTNIPLLHLALPLAISFFTLQQIAYLVDCYEGLVQEKNFLDYTIFVTFFPQLIAGPIVHHKDMMPQFANLKNKILNYKNIALGILIFSMGLFKKVVIADTFATWATNGFDYAASLNIIEAWITSLSYTFQLYFDFSGYTDMAIGAALLFNIKLPQNFNSPYKALNIIDFWKRWHITLTTFITTYIYTPIVKSFDKLSFAKAMWATFLTFFIAGLWHGASWLFITFGVLHGIGLVINHTWKKKIKINIPKPVSWFITFNYINIAFVFFRANDFESAFKVLSSMFSLDYIVLHPALEHYLHPLSSFGVQFGAMFSNIEADKWLLAWLVLAITTLWLNNSAYHAKCFKPNFKYLLLSLVLFISATLSLNNASEFLYFNF